MPCLVTLRPLCKMFLMWPGAHPEFLVRDTGQIFFIFSACPVLCGKTADQIRMLFGIVGRTGPGMRQVLGFGDRSTGRGIFGANFGHASITNVDFSAYVCDSAATRPSSQITCYITVQ